MVSVDLHDAGETGPDEPRLLLVSIGDRAGGTRTGIAAVPGLASVTVDNLVVDGFRLDDVEMLESVDIRLISPVAEVPATKEDSSSSSSLSPASARPAVERLRHLSWRSGGGVPLDVVHRG